MGKEVVRNTRMKLLIVTQVVDTEDSFLGFFVRWIEEFAKHVEHIEVICLREGNHILPSNVRVHSLGKEKGTSRIKYVFNFYRYIWRLRHNYDAVFVHMNPEYVILGGLLWRAWGKRIALWYTHKSVDLKLRLATWLTNIVFTASKESFRLKSSKVQVMGHGIDTNFFTPDPSVARGNHVLSVGRLMRSKRHDLAINIAAQRDKELHIAGEGPERKSLEELARTSGVQVRFFGGLTQTQLRDEYRKAAYLIHTSETGSLDKVVLEALACGLSIDSADRALGGLPFTAGDPQYVRERHSLQNLIPRMLTFMDIKPSDPKAFYDTVMPEKLGNDYEGARWRANPLLSAQYRMMTDVITRLINPNIRRASRVLEVGPGPGTWTKFFLEVNPTAQYTLVDISREMLAQAREKLSEHTNVSFTESDFLAFESVQPFDFFFSSRAIEYMLDKQVAVRKISSLLAPGAYGAVVTKMPKPFFDWARGRSSRTLHSAQIHPTTLSRLLRANGLTIREVRIATATVPLINSATLNEFVYRRLSRFPLFFPFTLFAESYLVTFRKPL